MADTTHTKHHDYHIIDPSPWPFLASLGAFVMLFGAVAWMRHHAGSPFMFLGANIATPWIFFVGLALVLYTMFAWWSDTIKEAAKARTRPSFRCICATA